MGILNSDDYGSLEPGRFVVFSGQYDSQRAADQGLEDLSGQVEGAYVRHVAPEAAGGGSATATPAPTTTAAHAVAAGADERQLRWVGKWGCRGGAGC